MPAPVTQDLIVIKGSLFTATVTIYNDARLKHWRGTWNEWRVYQAGEGVLAEAGPFVATLATQHTEPGVPPGEAFWSPLTPLSLTGYTAFLVCGKLFKVPAEIEASSGRIQAHVEPSLFTSAPVSEPYSIELIDPTGQVTYPVIGTMVFRTP